MIKLSKFQNQLTCASFKLTPGSNSSVESFRGMPTSTSTSFVDNSPYFDDLNASFKRLYKSVLNNRATLEPGFRMKMCPNNDVNLGHVVDPSNGQMNLDMTASLIVEPTLNAINTIDCNTSFDKFIQNIKLATAEVNWNDIDTSQFKCN